MKRWLAFGALGITLTACTPNEVENWLGWWQDDPNGAVQYAEQDWVQQSLANQCAGPCDDSTAEVTPEQVRNGYTPDSGDGDVPDDQYPTLGGSCSEWSDDALAVGWSADQWSTLSYIMYRESNCNPSAYNPSGASGLLQIMPMWADDCGGGDLFDPWFNLSCGLHILAVQGWEAWSTY